MIRKDLLKEFLSANNITTAIELQGALKNIFAITSVDYPFIGNIILSVNRFF